MAFLFYAESHLRDEWAKAAELVGKLAFTLHDFQGDGFAPRLTGGPEPQGHRQVRNIVSDINLDDVSGFIVEGNLTDGIAGGSLHQRYRQALTSRHTSPVQADTQGLQQRDTVGKLAELRVASIAETLDGDATDVALTAGNCNMRMAKLARGIDDNLAEGIDTLRAGDQGSGAAGDGFVGKRNLKLQSAWRDLQLQPCALVGGKLDGTGDFVRPEAHDGGLGVEWLVARDNADVSGAQTIDGRDAEAVTTTAVSDSEVSLLRNGEVLLEAAATRIDQANHELADPRVIIIGKDLNLATRGGYLEVIDHDGIRGKRTVAAKIGDDGTPRLILPGQRWRKHSDRTTSVNRGAVGRHRAVESRVGHGHPRLTLR